MALWAVLVVTLATGALVAMQTMPTIVAASPPTGAGAVAEVLREVNPSVVSIDAASAAFIAGAGNQAEHPGVGKGSGFFIDDRGHVVTNYHVVSDATDLRLTLHDGTVVSGVVVGRDPTSDLALIEARSVAGRSRPVRFGDSRAVRVGDPVIAIGDPYGLQRTVTLGAISGLDRAVQGPDGRMMPAMLQLDAAIGPGNSGGPLLNARGDVIGIVTARVTAAQAFGFAAPIERVRRVTSALIESGQVDYGWLGISGTANPAGSTLTPTAIRPRGVLIQRVAYGGPAHRAGLRGPQSFRFVASGSAGGTVVSEGGDLITAVDGHPVVSPCDLTRYLRDEKRPGESIVLDVERDGRASTRTVVLGQWPSAGGDPAPTMQNDRGQDDW